MVMSQNRLASVWREAFCDTVNANVFLLRDRHMIYAPNHYYQLYYNIYLR